MTSALRILTDDQIQTTALQEETVEILMIQCMECYCTGSTDLAAGKYNVYYAYQHGEKWILGLKVGQRIIEVEETSTVIHFGTIPVQLLSNVTWEGVIIQLGTYVVLLDRPRGKQLSMRVSYGTQSPKIPLTAILREKVFVLQYLGLQCVDYKG